MSKNQHPPYWPISQPTMEGKGKGKGEKKLSERSGCLTALNIPGTILAFVHLVFISSFVKDYGSFEGMWGYVMMSTPAVFFTIISIILLAVAFQQGRKISQHRGYGRTALRNYSGLLIVVNVLGLVFWILWLPIWL